MGVAAAVAASGTFRLAQIPGSVVVRVASGRVTHCADGLSLMGQPSGSDSHACEKHASWCRCAGRAAVALSASLGPSTIHCTPRWSAAAAEGKAAAAVLL